METLTVSFTGNDSIGNILSFAEEDLNDGIRILNRAYCLSSIASSLAATIARYHAVDECHLAFKLRHREARAIVTTNTTRHGHSIYNSRL